MPEKTVINEQTLVEFFKKLPVDTERDFELDLTDYVKINMKDVPADEKISMLKEILENNAGDTHRKAYDDDTRYAALYMLFIVYKYNKDFDNIVELINKNKKEFSKYRTFSHLDLLYKLGFKSGKTLDHDDVDTAYNNSLVMNDNAGMVHLFADITATYYEDQQQNLSSKSFKHKECAEDLSRAIEAVNTAIGLDKGYAKYHYTKSRLLYLEGIHIRATDETKAIEDDKDKKKEKAKKAEEFGNKLKAAIEEIDIAFQIEKPDSSNYVLNISAYQNHKIKAVVELSKLDITNETEIVKSEINKKIEDVKSNVMSNIEFIGFFAGIIALVLGSLQIATTHDFDDAAKLILVLFGSLLSVFAGFGIILHGYNKNDKVLACLTMFFLGILTVGSVLLFL